MTPIVTDTPSWSPVENEPPLRWLRRLRLLPDRKLGIVRRALLLALLTWLPLAVWAMLSDHPSLANGESLAQHYAVHVRCLVVIPLLILLTLRNTAGSIAEELRAVAASEPGAQARLDRALAPLIRLGDASWPWLAIIGVATAWSLVERPLQRDDAMAWAIAPDGSLAFGGWWFAYVSRPILVALLLAWLWRIALITAWFWRVGRAGLPLLPTHPDRAGGVAVVEKLPAAFAAVSFALAAMLASRWIHDITVHGESVGSFKNTAILFAVVWTLLMLLPLLAISPAFSKARSRGLAEYSALVGLQGRLVHRRWIMGQPVGNEPILDAPEIGPVADAASLFHAVKDMRKFPITKVSIVKILVPLGLPFLMVAALQIPIKSLLLELVKLLT
jgi:hypothetical protein